MIYAGDILCLLDNLGIARAIFVGTSMGGIAFMLIASLRPVVAGAVLNDVGPSLNPEGLGRIGGYVGNRIHVAGWAEAADYARKINERAFPHYGQAQWEAFARRIFVAPPPRRPHLARRPGHLRALQERRPQPPAAGPHTPSSSAWPRPAPACWCTASSPTCWTRTGC